MTEVLVQRESTEMANKESFSYNAKRREVIYMPLDHDNKCCIQVILETLLELKEKVKITLSQNKAMP